MVNGTWARDPTELIKVKCPKCERIYKRRVYWTGNGMPRIYCNSCQTRVYRLDRGAIEIHSTPLTKLTG